MSPPTGLVRSSTPTRNRPGTPLRPGPRLRSDTTIHHPVPRSIADYPHNQSYLQSQNGPSVQAQAPLYPYGAPIMPNQYNSNAYFPHNTNSTSSTTDYTLSLRSRSNSRSTNTMTLTNSSIASSLANTPRSGESFNLPVFQNPVRVNPMTGLSDAQEDAKFESIFLALSRLVTAGFTDSSSEIPAKCRDR